MPILGCGGLDGGEVVGEDVPFWCRQRSATPASPPPRVPCCVTTQAVNARPLDKNEKQHDGGMDTSQDIEY